MDKSASEQYPEISRFLSSNHTAVLATTDKQTATPHAAVVYYSVTSRLHVYFVTKTDTTKHRNLQANPQATMVIFDTPSQKTAQIRGTAQTVDNPQKLSTALEIMSQYAKQTAGTNTLPISRLDAGDYVLYQLTPASIRFGEFKYSPSEDIYQTAMPDDDSLTR